MESVGQRAVKLLAVKARVLKKKSAALAIPAKCVQACLLGVESDRARINLKV